MLTSILRYINLNLYAPAFLGNSYTFQFGRSDTVVDLHGMPLGPKFPKSLGFSMLFHQKWREIVSIFKIFKMQLLHLMGLYEWYPEKTVELTDQQQIHDISQKITSFLGVYFVPIFSRHIMQWPKPGGTKKSREVVWLGSLCFVLVASKTSGGGPNPRSTDGVVGVLVFGGDVRNGFEKMPDLRICIYFVCVFFFSLGGILCWRFRHHTYCTSFSWSHGCLFFAVLVPCQVSFISQVESCWDA